MTSPNLYAAVFKTTLDLSNIQCSIAAHMLDSIPRWARPNRERDAAMARRASNGGRSTVATKPEVRAQILADWQSHDTMTNIARRHGICSKTVRRVLVEAGELR